MIRIWGKRLRKHMHNDPLVNPSVAYEGADANVRAITKFGVGLFIGLLLTGMLCAYLFHRFNVREARHSPPPLAITADRQAKNPPEPRLQSAPRLDLKAMRDSEDSVLNHYAWVDPEKGIVRIPIDRAIEVVAQRGLPARSAGGRSGYTGQPNQSVENTALPEVSSSGRTTEAPVQ